AGARRHPASHWTYRGIVSINQGDDEGPKCSDRDRTRITADEIDRTLRTLPIVVVTAGKLEDHTHEAQRLGGREPAAEDEDLTASDRGGYRRRPSNPDSMSTRLADC